MYKYGIAILMVIASACGRSQDETMLQQEGLADHSDETSHSTLFTENAEFFIEYGPLVVGLESMFLVHVTELGTYSPFLSGQLTVMLEGQTVTTDHPERPGIFEIPFIPGNAGEFDITYLLESEKGIRKVSDHVRIYSDHEELDREVAGSAGDDHEEETGEISFLKEQAWNSDFMVSEIRPALFASVIHTSGEILAVPGEKKSIAATGPGIVHFTQRNLVQGSPVARGVPLFTISSESLIENNLWLRYQESVNDYEKSRSEYLRHKSLFAQGAISEREYISTRTGFVSDSLRYRTLAANISAQGLDLYAPVTGTIHELNVSEGHYVETGQIMATISSNQELLVRADLSQQFYDHLDQIVSANFRPAYTDRIYSVDEMNGRLLASGMSVAENDHYLPIIFEVKNDGSLLEGAFSEVFLKTSDKENTMVVPRSALLEEQGNHYLYIQVSGESFTKRRVSTGGTDGRSVEILNGLNPGDRVVTRGVMLVKAASMETTVAGHDHAH